MIKKILIIKHGALGDVIRTSYFLKPLFEQYGPPDIYWFTSKSSLPLLRFNPYVFVLTDSKMDLLNIRFDWIISLDDEWEILETIKDFNYKKITGAYIENGTRTYTEDSAPWFDMGLISKFGKKRADELKKLNKEGHAEIFSKILNIRNIQPFFYNSQWIENKFLLKKDKSFYHIGINSGAGGRWESKKLPVKETIKLIEELLHVKVNNKTIMIHLLGGEAEKERNYAMKAAIKEKNRITVEDSENSLLFFAAIVKSCDFIITSDSLALHFAISQGIPNLSFYAPTSAAEIDTFGIGVKVVSTSPDYCNYSSDCDNSSITAKRLMKSFKNFINE